MKYKVIDLFAGVGGMSLGFEMAGFDVVLANEYDKDIATAYKKNHSSTKMINEDITKLDLQSVFEQYKGNIDVIIGGPPCQGFSQKGKRKTIHDERNFLFKYYVKVVDLVKPQYFVMENVPNLLTAEKGYFKREIEELFSKMGYILDAGVLNAADYGVPQNRRRAVIIGKKTNEERVNLLPKPINKKVSVWDAISDLAYLNSGEGDEIQDYKFEARSEYQKKMRMNYVNENQLFHSQLESLIVALELVWRIASIKFKDSNKADSAERTGKKRFEKILSYTNNIDLFDTLIESNKKYCQVLYEWLQGKKNVEDTHLEKQLVRVINYLSDDVVLKMLDNNQNVYFNMTSVYEAMTQKTDEIDINGDGEAKGALRIVKGALGEGLNYYLAYNKNIVTMSDNVDYDEFVYYEQRVRERQKISNVNILLHAAENDDENTTDISCSKNRIIFGAPGTGKSHKLEENSKYFADNMERVTFHPNYSYANFVGAYKPIMSKSDVYDNLDTEKRRVLAVLQDKSMSAQEKYDELYDKFKDEGLTRLPLLLGIYTDENFKTRKVDGSDAAGDNSVERNHGRAIRPYLSLNPQNKNKEISYEFVPGPFMRIYVQAINHPEEDYLLLIEEINRANHRL